MGCRLADVQQPSAGLLLLPDPSSNLGQMYCLHQSAEPDSMAVQSNVEQP